MLPEMRPPFPSLEEVLKRMGDEPGWGNKFLIGGFLSFIPGANVFALGYLLQYARSIREDKDLGLPDWENWGQMFQDGLRMLVVWLIFWAAPVLVGLLLQYLWGVLVPAFFLWESAGWFFLAAGWVAGGQLYMAAVYRFTTLENLEALMDLRTLLRMAYAMRWQLALPVLLYTAVATLFWPVYGLAFFCGNLILVAYSMLNYTLLERAAGINR